jgi:glycosyltransferase involved in cell wall biosynthesis
MSRPAELLHFSPLAAVGGCEVNCLRVIEGLAGYRHRVVVFDGCGPMTEKWEAAGAEVEHLEAWRQGNRGFQSALTEWARSRREPAGVFYWSTSRLPSVLNILDGWNVPCAVYLGNPVADSLTARARLLLQEFAFGVPSKTRLVACSDFVAASHRTAFYFRGFPTETIYNAVGPAFDRPRIHRPLPTGSAPRVGMVARLDSIKDQLTIIRALAAVSAKRPDIVVEFAGDGDQRERLKCEADRLGVGDRVRFLGTVGNVAGLLAEWDVYVHSTTTAEGMGTAVAEAMMAGLPCLVTDIEVMREVCGPEGAAYAPAAAPAAWGEALLAIIDDRGRRAQLGSAAQDRARRLFGLSEVAARYLRTIRPNGRNELS